LACAGAIGLAYKRLRHGEMAFLDSGYFGGHIAWQFKSQVYMFTSWTSWVSSSRLKVVIGARQKAVLVLFGVFCG
jgi:hypothetical protein